MSDNELFLLFVFAVAGLWLVQPRPAATGSGGGGGILPFGGTGPVTSSHWGGVGPLDPGEVDTLARTIVGEASNQSPGAQEGVASVVLNRTHDAAQFASSVTGVCLEPNQFSCWSGGANTNRIRNMGTTDPQYTAAEAIATRALTGELDDNTGGAVYFFSPPVAAPPRSWGNVVFTVQIDQLRFYRKG